MAIDDNTIYGLYGSQIKDLPEKINAVKGLVKVLTTDDYNWNNSSQSTQNPTSVALWLMESGIYCVENGVPLSGGVRIYKEGSNSTKGTFIVGGKESGNIREIVHINDDGTITVYKVSVITGSQTDTSKTYLNLGDVVNNLTSTSTYYPLSAKQGKVLKDFIGDLTNLTTTDKTNLVAAINELDSDLAGKQDTLTAGSNITIADESGDLVISATQEQADWSQTNSAAADYIKNKPTIPTVGNGTITFTNNGATVGSFTANATANTTVALSAPVITMQASDPGEGVALVANNFIAVYDAS